MARNWCLATVALVIAMLVVVQDGISQVGKAYTPKNKRFTIIMPPGNKTGQRTQLTTIRKSKIPIEQAYSLVNGGNMYIAASIGIPATTMRAIPEDQRFDVFRDALIKAINGARVTSEKDLKQGALAGKDYQIEGSASAGRMQMYMQGGFVFFAIVEGKSKEAVGAKVVTDFFASFKMTPDAAEVAVNPGTGAGGGTGGGATKILGGAFDPEFKDQAPDGALLVGFDIGLGNTFKKDNIKAILPIYRDAAGKETKGKQYGTGKNIKRVVSVKAKQGYAVGALTVSAGLWVDGFNVTFMKAKGDSLDKNDSYKSDNFGVFGPPPVTLGGDGTLVIGVIGKTSKTDCSGLGLLLKK